MGLDNFFRTGFSSIPQTCLPERTGNLRTAYLYTCNTDLIMEAFFYFFGRSGFKQQLQSLAQVPSCRINSISLTCDTQFRAQRNISIVFPFTNCCRLYILSPPSPVMATTPLILNYIPRTSTSPNETDCETDFSRKIWSHLVI